MVGSLKFCGHTVERHNFKLVKNTTIHLFYQFEIIINVLVSYFRFIWRHIVASELKDPICHSNECQIGSFSSEATICYVSTAIGNILLGLSVRGSTLDVRIWLLELGICVHLYDRSTEDILVGVLMIATLSDWYWLNFPWLRLLTICQMTYIWDQF